MVGSLTSLLYMTLMLQICTFHSWHLEHMLFLQAYHWVLMESKLPILYLSTDDLSLANTMAASSLVNIFSLQLTFPGEESLDLGTK